MEAPDLHTPNRMAQVLRQSPATIRRAIEQTGVRPQMILDDLPYFDANAFAAIKRALGTAR